MPKLVIVLLLLGTLLYPSSSFAQQSVCFDEKVAGALIVAIEQKTYCEQQLVVSVAEVSELQKQIDIRKETEKLKDEQIVILKNLIETNKKLDEAKDKLHAEELKAAQPTFMQNLGKFAIGGVVGAVLAVTAIVLF